MQELDEEVDKNVFVAAYKNYSNILMDTCSKTK